MTQQPELRRFRVNEGLFTAVSAGFFLLLVGVIFVITPNLFQGIIDFFNGFTLNQAVPHSSGLYLPVPEHLAQHTTVYTAAGQFSLVWGIFQIVILAFRFIAGSHGSKTSETVGNVIFSLGTAYLINLLLTGPMLSPQTRGLENWFVFWATIIVLLGVSLIARGLVLAVYFWYPIRRKTA